MEVSTSAMDLKKRYREILIVHFRIFANHMDFVSHSVRFGDIFPVRSQQTTWRDSLQVTATCNVQRGEQGLAERQETHF